MTDLDTALRDLTDSALGAPADPPTSGMDVRLAAGRRRWRRRLAGAGGLALATAGVIAGATIWHPLVSTAPSDPAGTTTLSPEPGDAALIGNSPKVLVLPAGGTAMHQGPDAVAGTAVITGTDCVALRLPPAAPDGTGVAVALVLPPGTTSSESRLEPGPKLGDGRVIPQGSKITATGSLHLADTRYAAACPGTSGYVELNRPDLIAWEPPSQTSPPTTPETPGFTAATGVTWQTTLGDIALAADLSTGGDRTVVGPDRDVLIGKPLDLETYNAARVLDQIAVRVDDPAAQHVRFVALYADDREANDALLSLAEAAKAASGRLLPGPPDLTQTYAVTMSEDTAYITMTLRDETAALYPGSGHLGVRRVGNVLVLVSSTSEAEASSDNLTAWRTSDEKLLATLAAGLCAYSATGCG